MRNAIPNILTGSNLFCGALALMMVWQDNLWAVIGLLSASLVLDFLDGFVARLLKVSSPVGKELDSLADCVSFGVVPGMIMAKLIREAGGNEFPDATMWEAGLNWLWMIGLIMAVISALRLARFNLDTRQSDTFFGLATPANTMFVLGLWVLIDQNGTSGIIEMINDSWILSGITLFFSWLLLADVRLLALKFHTYGLKDNPFRYLLIAGSILFLILFGWGGLSFIILYYLALSFISNLREAGNLSGKSTA